MTGKKEKRTYPEFGPRLFRACYEAATGRDLPYPPGKRDYERAAEFVHGVLKNLSYSVSDILNFWFEGEVGKGSKKPLASGNFKVILEALIERKVSWLKTQADVRAFVELGRSDYAKLLDEEFVKELPEGPSSVYWMEFTEELHEKLSDQEFSDLLALLKSVPGSTEDRDAVVAGLQRAPETLRVAAHWCVERNWYWRQLLDELARVQQLPDLPLEPGGMRKILQVIKNNLPAEQAKALAVLGGLPLISYYDFPTIRALWQSSDDDTRELIAIFEAVGVLEQTEVGKWRIDSGIHLVLEHDFVSLPRRERKEAGQVWERRMQDKEVKQRLKAYVFPTYITFGKMRDLHKRRKVLEAYYPTRRNILIYFFDRRLNFHYRSDWEAMMPLQKYFEPDEYLFAQFVRKRQISADIAFVVVFSVVSFFLVVVTNSPFQYPLLFILVLLEYGFWIRIAYASDKAMVDLWEKIQNRVQLEEN